MPTNAPTADNIKNSLEFLFSSNGLPLRCDVADDFLGYIALVSGSLPEQYQMAIWEYFKRLGVEFRQVVMTWYPNGGTSIELRLRVE